MSPGSFVRYSRRGKLRFVDYTILRSDRLPIASLPGRGEDSRSEDGALDGLPLGLERGVPEGRSKAVYLNIYTTRTCTVLCTAV